VFATRGDPAGDRRVVRARRRARWFTWERSALEHAKIWRSVR